MILAENLTYSHPGNIPGIVGISVEIASGSRVAILGANGSGKSTLARCLNGIHVPQSGRVLVDGLTVGDPSTTYEIRRRVGMVFQNPDDQLVSTSVETEIAFGLENIGVPTVEMRDRVDEILETFQLTQYRQRHPHNLSGGEKQRVAIAAVIALRPQYLLLDEPTSLLDPKAKWEINDLLTRLISELKIACVQITQDPEEGVLADHMLVLDRGRLAHSGSPEHIFSQPRALQEIGLDIPFAAAVGERLSHMLPSGRLPYLSLEDLVADLALVCPSYRDLPPLREKSGRHPAIVRTEALNHTYDAGLPSEQVAICDISVEIPRASIVAMVGPSGSGKTTLAQHFNALLEPSSGRVLLDETDVWGAGIDKIDVRRRVGFAFQFPELQLFDETVLRDVAFGPTNLGMSEDQARRAAVSALDAVGLPASVFGERSPFSLSGGEMRRVALAGILAMAPEVLVLDEPTAGLDPQGAEQICRLLVRLREKGHTVVLIAHDMDLVSRLATEMILLNDSRLKLQGAAHSIVSNVELLNENGLEAPNPAKLVTALGEAGCNIWPGLLTIDDIVDYFEVSK
jgi:energy-coupling factor transporter ATPase